MRRGGGISLGVTANLLPLMSSVRLTSIDGQNCAWSWAKPSQIKIKLHKKLGVQPHPQRQKQQSPSDTEDVPGPREILPQSGAE